MTEVLAAAATALWLGLLTAVSPCPLATNVAALSVLARKVGAPRRALIGAAAYTGGRVLAYAAIAAIIFAGIASMPSVSAALRQSVLPLVGPVLILAGMAILGWLPLPISFKLAGDGAARRLSAWGIAGELGLGALFALSFCPVSAALFFGSLVPLMLSSSGAPLLLILYGIGTALPVAVIAVLLATGSRHVAKTLSCIQLAQKHAMTATGAILVAVGVWLAVTEVISTQ